MLMRSGGLRPPAAHAGAGNRIPTGINVGAGSVVVVVAAMLAAPIPVVHAGWRFAVVAVAIGLFTFVSRDWRAAMATALLGWLVTNGFLVDRFGELSWHGAPDLVRLAVLLLTAGFGLAAGEGRRWLRELRTWWLVDAELRALMTAEEKVRRDA